MERAGFNDAYWASQDAANQMWTPFVTFNDPLYDAADGLAVLGQTNANIGFASQGLISSNSAGVGWQAGCHLIAPDAMNGFTYNDGSSTPRRPRGSAGPLGH